MLVQEKLLDIYRTLGFEVRTGQGLRDKNFNIMDEFSNIYMDGQRLSTGWGLSFGELSVFDFLSKLIQPTTVFGIGNAFGWSTVALRLFFPQSRLAVIDAGVEGEDNMAGINLTNEILKTQGGGQVVYGYSPRDVPRVVEEQLGGDIQLCFIDGLHTNDQQAMDFDAVRPYLNRDHVVLFHDVRFCDMQPSFARIAAEYGDRSAILQRTTSGIGVVYSPSMQHRIRRLINLFS